MSIFSQRLKTLRKEALFTQDDLAKLLQIQRSTFSEYERGHIKPPMSKIKILADKFGVSVDYLIGNTNFKSPEERNEQSVPDIARTMKGLLDDLQNTKVGLTFDGVEIDDAFRKILVSSVKQMLEIGNLIKK